MDITIPATATKSLKKMSWSELLTFANWRHLLIHIFWLLYSSLFLSTGVTTALGAEINDLIIDSSRDHLLVSVNIRDVTSSEANAAPVANASATIIFSIALFEVKPYWFNKKIAHHTAINTIKRYTDPNEFRLLRSWHSGPPMKINAIGQARRQVAQINDLKVMPLTGLEKGRTYQIRVRAVCQDRNAFLFSPSECVKTDWHTVDFAF